jgi:hypothetical protein
VLVPVSFSIVHCFAPFVIACVDAVGSAREDAGPVWKLDFGRGRGSPFLGGAAVLSRAIWRCFAGIADMLWWRYGGAVGMKGGGVNSKIKEW